MSLEDKKFKVWEGGSDAVWLDDAEKEIRKLKELLSAVYYESGSLTPRELSLKVEQVLKTK